MAVLCFNSKTGFDPRTAKFQPIWIKFCTHLLFYGIQLWADLDRCRRVGSSRPNQNDYAPRFWRQTVRRVEVNTGAIVEKFRNFVAWAEPDPKNSIFRALGVPFDYSVHSLQERVLPQTDGKPRLWSLEVCLLLVWRVCDQAFGRRRYRPLKGAEKWSRDHHEN